MSELIDRQAAIDAISCDITITGRQNAELVAATIGSFADRIKALPSVQPTIEPRKTGHWIETGNMGHIDIDNVSLYQEMCDKCKGLSYFRKSANKLIGAKNCPNCGAKMEVSE